MAETVLVKASLKVFDQTVTLQLELPTQPVRMQTLLPTLRKLTDGFVGLSTRRVEAAGEAVSCKAGCGACCRQLVPIGEAEAREIADVVERLPEPRRTEIRGRFAAARERLEAEGLLADLLSPEGLLGGDPRASGVRYFQLGIACPFLEDESCSIYGERPIACREYLVTTPAERCKTPSAGTIDLVELPAKVWSSVARAETEPGRKVVRWVPLVLAPEWSKTNPERSAEIPAPELMKQVFTQITRKTDR